LMAFLMEIRVALVTVFWLPDGRIRVERRTSQHARLQAQDRPLADPAWRTELRGPRVEAASRRPGAKRVPGRGVVHDEPHIALSARPSTPSRRHVVRGTLSLSRGRLHHCRRCRHFGHAWKTDGDTMREHSDIVM